MVLFEPAPKQMQFIDCVFSGEKKYILYGGGIRSGKTYAGLGALILLCKAYPHSRWAIVRDTLQTLKRNTIPSFNKICPPNFIKNYNQDTQTVTFTNNSQILFFSENYADDKELNRWKGLEVNGFLFEEMNEAQELSFYKAIERAGSWIPPKPNIKPMPLVLGTCNPANNFVKTLFYDRWKDGSLPEDFEFIHALITDNPYIMADKEYIASLQNMPRYQYEVFVEGNWDLQMKTGGEFYKCFELDKHVAPTFYNKDLPLHISWDDNVNPYLPVGIFQIERKEIRMIDEIAGVSPNNTVNAVCKEIIRRYPAHVAGMFVYGDATANKEDTKMEKGYNFFRLILDYLKQYKPYNRVLTHNPSVVMRGNWINTVLEKEIGGVKIIIGDNCKKMINDLIALKEAEDGTKLKEMETDAKTKIRYQKVGHYSDLFEYIMCSAFTGEFAKWQAGDVVSNITYSKNYASKNSY